MNAADLPSRVTTGVRVESLTKTYGQFTAVDGIDLEIRPGELLTLLGASGSGKTTTLSMIAGFTSPSSGTVMLGDRDITRIPPHRRNIGMVFQHYSLFPHLSVAANVEFPLKQRGVPKSRRRELALEALALVDLAHKAQSGPGELSGGQQQRVAIARAIVFSPSLLLMDEPFGALDRALRERMQLELRRIHRELGTTVAFVTHDQQEALTMSDRIAVFEQGRIEQVGTPEDLYERPATLHVATFLGESNLISGHAEGGVLTTDGGVRIPVSAAVNGTATTVFRPERAGIVVGEEAPPALASLPATVTDVTYLGSDRRLDARTADGTPLVVRIEADSQATKPGDLITVTWDPERAVTFAS